MDNKSADPMESSGTLIAMITTMLSSSQVHDNVGFFFYLMQKICMKLRTKGRKVTEQETEKKEYIVHVSKVSGYMNIFILH